MGISFNLVPVDIRTPGAYIEIDNSKAFRGLSGIPTRVLLIGQKTSAGIAAVDTPIRILDVDQAVEEFGPGSQLAHMCEMYKKGDDFIEVHAIAQDDAGAGVAATATVTFGGALTAAGTLNLYIAGRRVRVAVAATDDPTDVATALAAAITADTDLPVTAAVNGGTAEQVDITAKNKGEEANYIDIRTNYYADEKTPAGLTVTIVGMAGGSGNPDVSDVISAIADEWYTDIVMAYADSANLTALKTELDTRFGPLKMIDGHAYVGLSDTHANLITEGGNHNSPHLTLFGAKSAPQPPYEWAAALAAQCAFHGKQDPARPLQTLALPGILPPAVGDRFDLTERDLLLRGGIATWTAGNDGTVRIERAITTYQENGFGADDISFLDVTTLKTLTYLRYDLRNYIALQYPRYKLANDGTKFARGQNVVTPSVIRASIIARFQLWEEQGLVENIEDFKEKLIVERDADDPNRVNALVPPDIVNQLRVFAGLVQFRL